MRYDFEWNPRKAQANIEKHDVPFGDGATIFNDPNAMTLYDSDHSEHEDRWITLGFAKSGRLLVVCHTFQEIDSDTCVIRIFSCRKADKIEREQYGG